jgi:hypothetical protein
MSTVSLLISAHALCGLAFQPAVDTTQATQPALLQPVDQGYADNNALQSSLRDTAVDMRSPSNWDRVYRVNANLELFPGHRKNGPLLARASGGIVAVFPQSTYVPVAPGVALASIPPGTVYTFADANALTRPRFVQSRSPHSPQSLSQPDRDMMVTHVTRANPRAPQEDNRTIWSSDNFRQLRVAQLLELASRMSESR